MNNLFTFVQRHGLRTVAALALVGLAGSLGVFNVEAWLADGLIILAILAAFFELIGLVFAVMVEDAARAKRIDRAAVCGLILLGCAAFNTVGGHKAWERSQAGGLAGEQQAAQSALDARRNALLDTIAAAQTRIERVPQPEANSYRVRQEEARATWLALTEDDRVTKSRAQAQLDALPVVAASPAARFDERLVWGFLFFLELVKVAGLWSLGLNVAPRRASQGPAQVVPFDASAAGRALVNQRRDRQVKAG